MKPAWEKVTDSNFAVSEYKDSTGRRLPCYSLTKTECLYIATSSTTRLVLRREEVQQLMKLANWRKKRI